MSNSPAEYIENNRKTMNSLYSEAETAAYLVAQVETMQRELTKAYWKAIEARSAIVNKFDTLADVGAVDRAAIPSIPFPKGGWSI